MSDTSFPDASIYCATAVGILDVPSAHRQNPSRHPQLRMAGPLGGDFRLPIRVMREIPGRELLDSAHHGARLLIEGRLEWATSPDEATTSPMLIASAARLVTPDDEDGCDIRMCGEITGPARIGRHPLRSGIALAHVNLRVQIPRTRPGSRAMLTETVRIPVVIPLNHPARQPSCAPAIVLLSKACWNRRCCRAADQRLSRRSQIWRKPRSNAQHGL